jgi:hypothetical protein
MSGKGIFKLTEGIYARGIRDKYEGEWKDGAKNGKGSSILIRDRSSELY